MNILALFGLVGTICTLLGISLRDIPVVTRLFNQFQLPYWYWNVVFLKRCGVSTLSPLAQNIANYNSIDIWLYRLYGIYKRQRITESIKYLGTPQQFRHNPKINVEEYTQKYRILVTNYLAKNQQIEVDVIFKLWSPYLCGNIDSRVLEVIQISCLVTLGYEIPATYKLPLIEFIQDYFVAKYIKERRTKVKFLEDMETALLFWLPKNN